MTKVNYYKKNNEASFNNINEEIKLPKFNENENRMVRLSSKMLGADGSRILSIDTETKYFKRESRNERSFTINNSVSTSSNLSNNKSTNI